MQALMGELGHDHDAVDEAGDVLLGLDPLEQVIEGELRDAGSEHASV